MENYIRAEMEVVEFETEDIITTSNGATECYDFPDDTPCFIF